MANAMREQIGGTSPQDIMKINENFESMWYKVHGDVDFVDTNKGLKNKIMTQWIPVQGSGNLDSAYPLDIRFYIPPNVDSIKSTNFSVNLSNYRMDSGIANGGGGVENVDINMSMGDTTVGVASVGGGGTTQPVNEWCTNAKNTGIQVPEDISFNFLTGDDVDLINTSYNGIQFSAIKPKQRQNSRLVECVPISWLGDTNRSWLVDLFKMQHVHDIPEHSHSISLSPHTHSGSGKVTLSPHTHALNEGIKVSTKPLQQTVVHINNEPVSILDGATQNVNNLDISQHIKVGEWNVIRCTSSSVARIELYGVIELIIKG